MEQQALVLDGGQLSGSQVVKVARKGNRVEIDEKAISLIAKARNTVEEVLQTETPIYGINTGFGALSTTSISNEKLEELQMNLLRSHAAGVGEPLDHEIVRGMMLLLAASLCRGYSGVRPIVAETLVEMLNAGVTPIVPSRGSVGASGDLAPLAHLALVVCGEGKATLGEKEMPGKAAMAAAGIT
ncbi:MAG: aromatic amino acid lyase, partial [Phycisphaerales bacterium]|nr:aromatic amino acid lyase [Phycisphaerales bacterium]